MNARSRRTHTHTQTLEMTKNKKRVRVLIGSKGQISGPIVVWQASSIWRTVHYIASNSIESIRQATKKQSK